MGKLNIFLLSPKSFINYQMLCFYGDKNGKKIRASYNFPLAESKKAKLLAKYGRYEDEDIGTIK